MAVRKLGKRLTVEGQPQDPIRVINQIRAGHVDPKTLSKEARQELLLVMANGKQTSTELASFFNVRPEQIRRDLQDMRARIGAEVKNWSLDTILGRLSLAAEKCTALAHKQEDPGLAWSIERDFARSLKELGITGQGATPGRLTLTLEGVGEGYERAAQALRMGMDPRLTGAVLEGEVLRAKDDQPALPLQRTLDGTRPQAPEQDDEPSDDQADADEDDLDQE